MTTGRLTTGRMTTGRMTTEADEVWALMTTLVHESRVDWRRAVGAELGIPFSRVKVLRLLKDGPLTQKALAEAALTDAPAATVAVNELVRRGLVVRSAHPDDGRVRLVSLTEAGEAMLARAQSIRKPAPPGVRALGDTDLALLRGLLERVAAAPEPPD
ncbi:MarR family winged helix-turn-helix transcriptional regulator [Leifsonia poae]|uniref:MarR family winged helix-turn-helix transcriptional regulator n=1 Tax=Leifsonia poae TaxID=110933 RepID=UPI001CBDE8BB|nr:MarR family transcriptional regulator [Leifsonia poae]